MSFQCIFEIYLEPLLPIAADVSLPGSDLEFYKLRYKHQRYLPLSDDLTLMLGADLAYGGKDKLPCFENYYAGGPRSIRGFKANTLGPREIDGSGDPVGGNLRVVGNVELIFPSPIEDFEKSMRVSTFFDIGNVFNTEGKETEGFTRFETDDLRYSVGISTNWLSPLGILTLSYAEPLNDESVDKIEKFQFTAGTTF